MQRLEAPMPPWSAPAVPSARAGAGYPPGRRQHAAGPAGLQPLAPAAIVALLGCRALLLGAVAAHTTIRRDIT
jgi:hypothetical protein